MAILKRTGSKFFWARFQFNGVEVRESTKTTSRPKAREFERSLRDRLWRESKLGHQTPRSFDSCRQRWLHETTKRSVRRDEEILSWFCTQLPGVNLGDIDADVVAFLRRACEAGEGKPRSKSTVDRYMSVLRAVLRRARDEWQWVPTIPKIPMFHVVPTDFRWLTRPEFDRLYVELPRHLKPAALVAVNTGLRLNAMLTLRWTNVDLERKLAWISLANMKTKRPLRVPLNDTCVEVLRSLQTDPEWVFVYRGRRLKDCNTRAFQKAVKPCSCRSICRPSCAIFSSCILIRSALSIWRPWALISARRVKYSGMALTAPAARSARMLISFASGFAFAGV